MHQFAPRYKAWARTASKARKDIAAAQDLWPETLEKQFRRVSAEGERLAVDFAVIPVPKVLAKAHKGLVDALRKWSLMNALVAEKVHDPNAPGASDVTRENRLNDTANQLLSDWRFALRVQAKKMGLNVPWEW